MFIKYNNVENNFPMLTDTKEAKNIELEFRAGKYNIVSKNERGFCKTILAKYDSLEECKEKFNDLCEAIKNKVALFDLHPTN